MSNVPTLSLESLRSNGYVSTQEACNELGISDRGLRRRVNGEVASFGYRLSVAQDESGRRYYKIWNTSTEQARLDGLARSTVTRRAELGLYRTTSIANRTFYRANV